MGINSLSSFLRKNYPDLFTEVHLSTFGFKKVAIDISNHICRLKASCGEQRWLSALVSMIACLRRHDVHPVFIYDSGSPPEKEAERARRIADRDKRESRIFELRQACEEYHRTQVIAPILVEYHNERSKNRRSKDTVPKKRLLGKSKDEGISIPFIESCLAKAEGQMFTVTKADYALTQKLLTVLRIPFFNAPLEAETMAADLCKRGLVDAVLSEDTDVLAYGAPKMLTKLSTTSDSCIELKSAEVLTAMGIDYKTFVDFCIMCGTDYNDNIPGVGPAKALAHILKHRTIEGVGEKTALDVSILKHTRGRELFLEYKRAEVKVPHCAKPHFPTVEVFFAENNLHSSVATLKVAMTQSRLKVEFVEEYEEE